MGLGLMMKRLRGQEKVNRGPVQVPQCEVPEVVMKQHENPTFRKLVRWDFSGPLEKGGLDSKCQLSAFSRGVSVKTKGVPRYSQHDQC